MLFLERYKYPIAGGLLGLIFILPFLTLGFVKALILFAFIAICAFLGHYFRHSGVLENILSRFHM
ncbi:DUF2273 domain-containing protein [Streptococcus moroccensis]|uniref:Membrane protein n=1 Tax=Streptococcus moroccensis TaxID=1451356 RepID=A0ABT9YPP3_9STRE|nr:DUF2273 domain-containing protein [Streptococcus moroccensis]MDQ0221730.1 putative membrane protein [Streptococcus moroccensis]